ncbi:nuclear hormone receptor FTZ-F1 [Pogonomyrmex barbatus]|uniref:Nuclear hormone receptor FTZ-F1 n=1 Tax=Pogonomyrmex barbatus TaxID=144034 RepID=A0A6I9WJC4_9HYME|nr:nuclear hormone receptor FTZ-F1 [Pogonomyrmex barbatus]
MGDMLLEMEQHSGLISLSMSPFHLSPQGSPQAAGQQTPQQQQPQPHYGSAYSSCAQSSPSPMCHQPQSQSQQQQQMSAHGQAAQSQSMSGFEAAFFEPMPLEDPRCPIRDLRHKKVYTCRSRQQEPESGTGGCGGTSTSLDGNGGGGGYTGSGGGTAAGGSGPGTTNATVSGGAGGGGPAAAAGSGNVATGGAVPTGGGTLCHPGLGQVGVVTGSIPCPSDFPDTKDIVIEELCPVCGDKVSGYHYGLLTCESCKGFFKRTVQNKKVYTCVAERSCHIDKTQRKRCPYCRFQKCLEVGMKLEAVRADRMRGGRNKFGPMYKRDRARKLQLIRQRQLAIQTIRVLYIHVDDQMKLLQHSWSDMLVLDHLHQRLHNNLPDETTLHNGQKFDLLCLGLLGVPSLAETFRELSKTLQELKFDSSDYICMKFLMLLNHDVRGLVNKKHVQEGHEQVQHTLMEYTLTSYPSIPDKFHKLLAVLPDIHEVATKGEEHLYQKHCNGGAPTQTLLMEMLHAKRK